MRSTRRLFTPIAIAASSLILAVTPSLAAPSKSSIALVVLSSASTVSTSSTTAHYGDQVTFAVSTTATDRPYVKLNCYQAGSWVYAAATGFWAGYVEGQNFTLVAASWPGGAADCTAVLGSLNADGTKFRALASTSFHVDA